MADRNAADTAYADQVNAAVADAKNLMTRLSGPLNGDLSHRSAAPRWLAEAITRHNTAPWRRTCSHYGPPQVYNITVCLPGLVVCSPCAAAGALLAPADEEWVCDACRREQPHQISICTAQIDMTIIWFGLCCSCRETFR